ncbi:MAG: hypothetical protein ABI041_02280 [Bdellovibrionia bacterium]
MPYSLIDPIRRFQIKTAKLHIKADSILSEKSTLPYWKFRYLSEGLMLETWQSWNSFCRISIINSCLGCLCTDGIQITARTGDNSWQRIGFIFKSKTIAKGLLKSSHNEPTWGDIDKLIAAASNLKTVNELALLSAFGLPTLNESAKHMQTVRNCIAHKNPETINNVKKLYLYYSVPSGDMRPHELIWQDNASGEIAYFSWLADLRQMAVLSGLSVP